MKTVIVIPTYNEIENVGKLVSMLAEEFKYIDHDVQVLFVDDNSPDGTSQKIKELQKNYPFVKLMVRKEKLGLGSAYSAGFKKAMAEMNADVLMEMDADLQHDPKDVKRLLAEIDKGADFVIGSRYMKGGSIPKEWDFKRKFLSWGGNLFTRVVLGMYSFTEFTTSFRATRVKGVMDQIDFDDILSKGFAYKLDTIYRIYKNGAKMVEIPIAFGLRDRGDSKMEQNNFTESLRVVLFLRIRESLSFLKFAVVGFTGFFVDAGVFNVLRLSLFSSGGASAISGVIGMLTTFTLNNAWSFGERKIVSFRAKVKMFIPYAISSYIPILFRSWLVEFAVTKFGNTGLVANFAFVIGVGIGLVWNFAVYSKIIWRKKPT